MERRMKYNLLLQILVVGLLTTALYVTPALSQWSSDPTVNTPICTAAGNQDAPTIVSDGSGGAIITWMDNRNGNFDIYAQRANAFGSVLWPDSGVAICMATGDQTWPAIVSDGSGGAIITWMDSRSGNVDIYAQRINASGTVQWATDGVAICSATGDQESPTIVSDGSGGAIITWQDARSGNNDIYAQRVNSSGVPQWTPDGVGISTAANDQMYPTIDTDGSGGAIITWQDTRSGNYDIYAQRVNTSGVPQWTADGVAICTATSNQQYPTIVSDSSGGAIITWEDPRSGNFDIYAQRVNASGVVQWTPDGDTVCSATGDQQFPTIITDGSGGAIITWEDARSGSYDIYAQRVNASGAVQWPDSSVAICTATGDKQRPILVSDGSGGAIITWDDARSDIADVYAQHVNASGVVQWTPNGAAICTATGDQAGPTIASDDSGGAIITWYDKRSGNYDIYAQHIAANGTLPIQPNYAICTATGDQIYPNSVSDGSGGAITTWQDARSGDIDIYAQRVNASGTVQWTANGIAISTATGDQSYPTIDSDSSGGAIIAWQDARSGDIDIYAQRVNSSGVVQWIANGVAICTATGIQQLPTVISDGSGGAIIVWEDLRATNWGIYAQRVNSSGVVQWTANGVAIDTANDGFAPTVVSDGAGGAIITWWDLRNGIHYVTYAQRVSSSGVVQWTANGVAICTRTGEDLVQEPQLSSDGSGGAIITWLDTRNDNGDIYAQRVDASGLVLWTTNGVAICAATGAQGEQVILPDGSGGAIIAWDDYRRSNKVDIYAQRVNASGLVQWTTDGVAIDTGGAAEQSYPTIVSDGSGGAFITWVDGRNDIGDIYAQRVDPSGLVQWTVDGIPVCTATNLQAGVTVVSDGSGGAIITWEDKRSGTNFDIYAQHLAGDAALPIQLASLTATTLTTGVQLQWTTVSETNSLGFYVERRALNAGTFATVSNLVPGAGTTLQQHHYQWTDTKVTNGKYNYRLKLVDLNGSTTYSNPITVTVSGVLGVGDKSLLPKTFALHQNYPNPFNPTTVINYELPKATYVRLTVYDMLGREVATLVNETQDAGYKSVEFSASNLPSGIYVYRLTAGTFVEVKKMLMIK